MGDDVVDLEQIDRTQVATVGGKGAHLGELMRIEGVRVPPGFCVTTGAFDRILAGAAGVDELLDQLAACDPDDLGSIAETSAAIRRSIEAAPVPDDLLTTITGAVVRLGERAPCAVRSSATAEDRPTASSAGQQDTYLNVVGAPSIVAHIRRCWASLFTERAVTYRARHGEDHRQARMAVVVQQLVAAEVSGVLFTADPVTSTARSPRWRPASASARPWSRAW